MCGTLGTVPDVGQTERQDDSAFRSTDRDTAPVANVRVVLGATARDVHEIRVAGTRIGRTADGSVCDIAINDARMSREHVQIERTAVAWQLVDVGSRNGGFVNGRAFAPRERLTLADGAVIRLGDTLMVFRSSPSFDDGCSHSPAFPGVSSVAAAVRRRIGALACSLGHVLVLGETGTGKERVARALADLRPGRPFVPQNCAELTRELARTDLFGHVRGAFSGATLNKPGLVELANDGVLFLDEIGELAIDVQGDLLRFLEDGRYRPVGATDLRHSTARVVAATNVDLDLAVAAGRFRRDLAARLRASNTPLVLPPLRERREDIPGWARLFLDEVGQAAVHVPWSAGALECLLLYPWPENLRELRGVVRGLAEEPVEPPISPDRLPPRLREHRAALRGPSSGLTSDPPTPTPREPTREEIEQALIRTQGRMRTAATQLGIDRRKLYRLCERFGISVDEHRGRNSDDD
jgi:DNA-binding NtrC family response regulator